MAAVLELAREAAISAGLKEPTSLAEPRESIDKVMRVLADTEGRALSRMRNSFGDGWADLMRESSFTGDGAQTVFDLPHDVSEVHLETFWAPGSVDGRALAATSIGDWAEWKYDLPKATLTPGLFRLRRGRSARFAIEFDPPIPDGEEYAFFYISRHWIGPVGNPSADRIGSDTDHPVFDDDVFRLGLRWRLMKHEGFDHTSELAEYEQERDTAFAAASGANKVLHPDRGESGDDYWR